MVRGKGNNLAKEGHNERKLCMSISVYGVHEPTTTQSRIMTLTCKGLPTKRTH